MNKLYELSLKIESLRKKMHDLIKEHNSLTSSEILLISQELDELIVEYNKYYTKINSSDTNKEND